MQNSILLAVITLVGVTLTAFVTWLIAQRQILVQHVTAARDEWRKNIRAQALEVHNAIMCRDTEKLGRLQNEFRLLLNPFDCQDQEILDSMAVDESRQERQERTEEFAGRISLLLKHDWERAKLEAGFFLCGWVVKPIRLPWNGGDVSRVRGACSRELRWCKKNRIRWIRVLVLAIGVVAMGILVCVCNDSLSALADQRGATGASTTVSAVDCTSGTDYRDVEGGVEDGVRKLGGGPSPSPVRGTTAWRNGYPSLHGRSIIEMGDFN